MYMYDNETIVISLYLQPELCYVVIQNIENTNKVDLYIMYQIFVFIRNAMHVIKHKEQMAQYTLETSLTALDLLSNLHICNAYNVFYEIVLNLSTFLTSSSPEFQKECILCLCIRSVHFVHVYIVKYLNLICIY